MSLTYEPSTFYDMAVTCNTAGTDGTDPCQNFGRVWGTSLVYSNTGTPSVSCGKCDQPVEVLNAVKVEPQPVIS
jgi:hypothetical protein